MLFRIKQNKKSKFIYMIKKIIDYKNNKRVIFINKYNHYNVLIFSSLTFLLPCYYAYLNKIYSLSIISLLVSIISTGHWYKVDNFTLRIMDLIMAKIGFGVYLSMLILYTEVRMFEIFFVNMLFLFYYFSNTRLTNEKNDWVYYHFIFHMFVTIDQIIIIKRLIQD